MCFAAIGTCICNVLCCCWCCCRKKEEKQEKSITLEKSRLAQEGEDKQKELLRRSLVFFRKNVARIDIIREGNLEKVYFPVMPFCKYLRDKDKEKFHNLVDRTSTKTKLNGLLIHSTGFIDVMLHENSLRETFNRYFILKFLDWSQPFWVFLSFFKKIRKNFRFLTQVWTIFWYWSITMKAGKKRDSVRGKWYFAFVRGYCYRLPHSLY